MSLISILCNPNDFTGHGIHSCNIIKYLPEIIGCEIIVRPMRPGPAPDWVKPLCKSGENSAEWEIIVGPPKTQPTHGKKTIYLSTSESTRLPASSVQMLNAAEIVVVPSQWCATVFSASGVTRPIYVVPLGFSPEVFEYRPMPKAEPFTFACAGQLGNGPTRKGLQRIIHLFQSAFIKTENVRLHVKCLPGEMLPMSDPRIDLFPSIMEETRVADWLSQCHCFINLATEGFGLWPLQACTMGKPVISPLYAGVADYLRDGLTVAHHLVPAGDTWAGHGLWAEADEDAVIAAMRYAANPDNLEAISRIGHKAHWNTRHLTWGNSISNLARVIKAAGFDVVKPKPVPRIAVKRSADPLDDVTVCITAFNRQKYLERAKASAIAAGFKVVVVEMTPEKDFGVNELWMRAAYAATTERVIILHDDDTLLPELGQVYRRLIAPALDNNLCVSWRGAHLHENGKITPTEYRNDVTRTQTVEELESFLLQRGKLSLSPVVTVFDRETLIHACKESDKYLTGKESYLRPGMLLGTEIIAHLRQLQEKKGWLYINEVLSHYGVHAGSGTTAASRAGKLAPLIAGYDFARRHYETHRDPSSVQHDPKFLLIYSDYKPTDKGTQRRFANARWTWEHHFDLGAFMDFPIPISALSRTSRGLGDKLEVPYFNDLFDIGCRHAMPEDIIVFLNNDIALTANAERRIIEGVNRGDGVCVAWRRCMPVPSGRMVASAKNGKIDGGVDLVAFRKDWWMKHRSHIPEMLIALGEWDYVLRIYCERLTGGRCYIDDAIMHEPHESILVSALRSPARAHNIRAAIKFFDGIRDVHAAKSLREILAGHERPNTKAV